MYVRGCVFICTGAYIALSHLHSFLHSFFIHFCSHFAGAIPCAFLDFCFLSMTHFLRVHTDTNTGTKTHTHALLKQGWFAIYSRPSSFDFSSVWSPCKSDVHKVKLSRSSCIISVESLYESSLTLSNSVIASSKARLAISHA